MRVKPYLNHNGKARRVVEVDIEFLLPLVLWYQSGSVDNLPVRITNALDSLSEYFE